jgi:hypothetical protein
MREEYNTNLKKDELFDDVLELPPPVERLLSCYHHQQKLCCSACLSRVLKEVRKKRKIFGFLRTSASANQTYHIEAQKKLPSMKVVKCNQAKMWKYLNITVINSIPNRCDFRFTYLLKP